VPREHLVDHLRKVPPFPARLQRLASTGLWTLHPPPSRVLHPALHPACVPRVDSPFCHAIYSGVSVGRAVATIEMAFDAKTAIGDFEERVANRIAEARLNVFVCGPAVDDASGARSKEPGACVRLFVSERISKAGHSYIWGEHLPSKGGAGEVAWIRRFDDANKEIMFALHNNTDLVVIFPSSSGSLAELGAFCMHDKISPKLLIIFDRRYRGDKGFVVKALGKAARSRKASIHFKDYGKPSSVWQVVRREIERTRMLKTVRMTHEEK
jgi:hypothetical protein